MSTDNSKIINTANSQSARSYTLVKLYVIRTNHPILKVGREVAFVGQAPNDALKKLTFSVFAHLSIISQVPLDGHHYGGHIVVLNA